MSGGREEWGGVAAHSPHSPPSYPSSRCQIKKKEKEEVAEEGRREEEGGTEGR